MTPTPDRPARTAAEIGSLDRGYYIVMDSKWPYAAEIDEYGDLIVADSSREFPHFCPEEAADAGLVVTDRLIPQSEAEGRVVEAVTRVIEEARPRETRMCAALEEAWGLLRDCRYALRMLGADAMGDRLDDYFARQGDTADE